MTKIVSSTGVAWLAPEGKRMVAETMYAKGQAFVIAAALLRRNGGYEYAVLHLLCQGVEVGIAAQALACTRSWGLPDDAEHVNPTGGAISIGHPLGASGARLVGTAMNELARRNGRYALASMCIGVGQGIALAIERV